jgi:hypothetical protein
MARPQLTYTDGEWHEISRGRPLAELELTQLMLVHRHWIWARREQELVDMEIRAGRAPKAEEMAADSVAALFLWYSLLWSVIEALEEREVVLQGRFADDVQKMSKGLRRCRNAIFHIPRADYYDARMFNFMEDPDSGPKIRRISDALGRLLLEEFDARDV